MGNVKTNTAYEIHNATTETEIATPRILVGNISEISTHVTGASETAYVPMAASKVQAANGDFCFNNTALMMYNTANANAPNNIKGFRPSLSTNHIARTVKSKLITPI